MGEFLLSIWDFVYTLVVAFFQSKTFFVIKIFLAIYTTVLVVDVLLLMYLSDVKKRLRQLRKGVGTSKVTKSADIREWQMITKRLSTDDEKQYRAAILEADQFVYKALETQGYSGANFAERIAQVPTGSFSALDVARDVHDLSVKIVHDDELRITKEQAKNALDVYERFLKNLDVL